jgi:hypothetical protein
MKIYDFDNGFSINSKSSLEIYKRGGWGHYYKHNPNNVVGDIPEIVTTEIKPLLPDYIDSVLNFGCANGRDFIPFQDNYNLIGFDIKKRKDIDFVCKTDNLTYYQCTMQDYMHENYIIHEGTMHKDLSKSLVYTNVSLMYLDTLEQEEFISYLLDNGCKNMVFQEYPGPRGIKEQMKHFELFNKCHRGRTDVTCYEYLDNK